MNKEKNICHWCGGPLGTCGCGAGKKPQTPSTIPPLCKPKTDSDPNAYGDPYGTLCCRCGTDLAPILKRLGLTASYQLNEPCPICNRK